MKWFVGLSISVSALAASMPAQAQTQAQDPESAQIMCDLTGDCGAEASAATDPASPETGRHARTGNTRGFTFQRQTTQTAAPAEPTNSAPTRLASRTQLPSVVRPPQVGASNLKVTFIPGSSALSEPSKARLAKYAAVLSSNQLAARRLRIEGYTDASGSSAANRELSRRRAQAVADYLASEGVDRSRIDVVGYGDTRLLPGIPATSAENRRVVAVLL